MDVIIVGAGIGGLTAALELHRVGINARIYELVEEIKPLGVGINLLPHATKVLGECGLLDAIAAAAIETEGTHLLQQVRPEDMERAARHRGGLCLAAIVDPSRRSADDPAAERSRAAWCRVVS